MPVYVLLAGGLGNQLFQYSAALEMGAREVVFVDFIKNARQDKVGKPEILSLKLEIPVLFFRTFNYKKYIRRYFLWLLGATSSPTSLRYKASSSFIVTCLTSTLIWCLTGIKMEVVLENRLEPGQWIFRSKKPKFIIGYFQSRLSTQSVVNKIELTSLLTPSLEFESALRKLEQNKFIGVHIRRGDYVGHPTFGLLSYKYFKDAIVEFWENDHKIILFSDSLIEICDYVPDWLEASTSLNTCNFSGAEVLILMSRCQKLIMSNSSLSWWAGYIAQSFGHEVIAPDPWFRSELQSPEFFHGSWKRRRSLFHDTLNR
jgi:hypothetical protein